MIAHTEANRRINKEREPLPRRILLVQTDWEMGMARLAKDLVSRGHFVSKIILNFSDHYYRLKKINAIPYTGPVAGFEKWLEKLVIEGGYDTFFLYNPFRPYNQAACRIAQRRGMEVVHFDQGLLRPLHVSVFNGVGFPFETMRQHWETNLARGCIPRSFSSVPMKTISATRKNLLFSVSVLIALLFKRKFPFYEDQREMSLSRHLAAAARHLFRTCLRSWEGWHFHRKLAQAWSKNYFLVPLQLDHDVQIKVNSPFVDLDQVIDHVAASFKQHAQPQDRLIFKIHPLDRGYRTYRKKFREIRQILGKERVFLLDRVHLDTLLAHAKGVVTVNSTVGLTALRSGTPVKVLGKALYDQKGLTFSSSLDDFWTNPPRPDLATVGQFINLLEMTIQGRGTLARPCYDSGESSGILWPEHFGKTFGLSTLLHTAARQSAAEISKEISEEPASLPQSA